MTFAVAMLLIPLYLHLVKKLGKIVIEKIEWPKAKAFLGKSYL